MSSSWGRRAGEAPRLPGLYPSLPRLGSLADELERTFMTRHDLLLDEARQFAEDHCVRLGLLRNDSADRILTIWRRFERYAAASGVNRVAGVNAALVAAFVHAPTTEGPVPSVATTHLRRFAIKYLFRLLREIGLSDQEPTLDLGLPDREYPPVRALTDPDIERGRWASLTTTVITRHPFVWALAETGAATSEIGEVAVDHVDLLGKQVRLPGGPKHFPRTVPLTDWGAVQLGRRLQLGNRGLVTGDDGGTPASRRTLVTQSLQDSLRRAGIGGTLGMGPRSITAWVGRKVLVETGRIECVALGLGMRSLDAAAALIGHQWRVDEGDD